LIFTAKFIKIIILLEKAQMDALNSNCQWISLSIW